MADLPMHYATRYVRQGPDAEGLSSIDGRPDLAAGSPHDDDRYSPEHLLVAAAEICLGNTVRAIAMRSRLNLLGYVSRARGELEFEPGAGYRFKLIVIEPQLTVPASDEDLAKRVIDRAHGACLIARSLNCPVEIEPLIHTE